MSHRDVIIGIDSGTSVSKAVAFDLGGCQLGVSAVPNVVERDASGAAVEQDMDPTWERAADTLRGLASQVEHLRDRVAAIAVTGQGDGTWLIDDDGRPVSRAWLWLDSRAAPMVEAFEASGARATVYNSTGCGMNASNQSGHLAWLARHSPDLLERASTAMHCKDWLYFKLTGVRVTDVSEGTFTFGNYRTREYDPAVLEALGLGACARLLPPMVDGGKTTAPLSAQAAGATGLPEGIPVALGYDDILCTALGAGAHTADTHAALSIVGSTGMQMMVRPTSDVALGDEPSGYTMPFIVPGHTAQMQSNMAATLNIDWLTDLAVQAAGLAGAGIARGDMLRKLDAAAGNAEPASALYHPYIDRAGERGPFFDPTARAQFFGLSNAIDLAGMMRSVYDGLALAARDCFTTMGHGKVPPMDELRIAGGAARSRTIRQVFADVLGVTVRESTAEEAGAAGVAMMAGVAIGALPDYQGAVARWVEPTLGASIKPEPRAAAMYDELFELYLTLRQQAPPHWRALAAVARA